MSTSRKPMGLGRGLDALLSLPDASGKRSTTRPPPSGERAVAASTATLDLFRCAIEKIEPNRDQPRKHFSEDALKELSDSIRTHGLLEPIVVRRLPKRSDRFQIVAGERRFRACQKAGLHEVPVHLRDVEDRHALELALVENIQREDLNALEFAKAVQTLLHDHEYTQETLAARLHKDRSTLANAMRLLKLPQRVQQMIVTGQLTEGHGRALLASPDEASLFQLAQLAVDRSLSVRQTEAAAKALKSEANPSAVPEQKSPGVRDLETRLARRYGTRCEVRDKKGKGEIRIRYANLDELDRILEQMFP